MHQGRRSHGQESSPARVAVLAGSGWRGEVVRAALRRAGLGLCDPSSAEIVILIHGAVRYEDDLERLRREAVLFTEFPLDARRHEVHLLPAGTTPDGVVAAVRAPRRVPRQRTSPPAASAPQLSPRERQVLSCLSQGHSNAQIASALEMSPNTARTHVQNLLGKMQAPNRAAAVAFAHRMALI